MVTLFGVLIFVSQCHSFAQQWVVYADTPPLYSGDNLHAVRTIDEARAQSRDGTIDFMIGIYVEYVGGGIASADPFHVLRLLDREGSAYPLTDISASPHREASLYDPWSSHTKRLAAISFEIPIDAEPCALVSTDGSLFVPLEGSAACSVDPQTWAVFDGV